MAIYQKFVLFGLSAENGVVFQDEALHLGAGLALEEQGCGQSANSAADDNAIVHFAGIGDVFGKWIVESVANGVSSPKNL